MGEGRGGESKRRWSSLVVRYWHVVGSSKLLRRSSSSKAGSSNCYFVRRICRIPSRDHFLDISKLAKVSCIDLDGGRVIAAPVAGCSTFLHCHASHSFHHP